MTRLTYLVSNRLPTEKAHGYQIAKMCESFADLGYEVELIHPERINSITTGFFESYGVEKNFEIRSVPGFDWGKLYKYIGKLYFQLNRLSFFLKSWTLKIPAGSIIYTRSPELVWVFAKRGFKTFFECHQLPATASLFFGIFLQSSHGVVAITQGLKDQLASQYHLPAKKILVAADGVDLKTFDVQLTRQEARQKLNLPLDKKVILYTGQLFAWKGVDVLAEATSSLPDGYLVYLVGGTKEDIATFKSKYQSIKNLICLPSVPRDEVAIWLKAADLLVLPNSKKFKISESHTSPLKLFEYMASQTPILASDLPSLHEILSPEEASFFKADDPTGLARQTQIILQETMQAEVKAKKAYALVKSYTWTSRAKNISDKLLDIV